MHLVSVLNLGVENALLCRVSGLVAKRGPGIDTLSPACMRTLGSKVTILTDIGLKKMLGEMQYQVESTAHCWQMCGVFVLSLKDEPKESAVCLFIYLRGS